MLLPTAGDQIPALPLFLSNRTWVDLRPQLNETGLDRLQWGITGQKPRRSSPRPADSAGQRAAARFLAAADGTYLPHLARQYLDAAGRQLGAIDNQRRASPDGSSPPPVT